MHNRNNEQYTELKLRFRRREVLSTSHDEISLGDLDQVGGGFGMTGTELRLQMVMDRSAKMMSTLSNILKKMSDTSQSIAQNLK